jgi:RNA polymerase sigma factor (TIGR02999 family)
MKDITRVLNAIEQGDGKATEELLPLVYEELRCLAAQRLSNERPGQTLQATALVHEAYIRLIGTESPNWNGRGHFFGAAAEAMRRILVENARRKQSLKRGGEFRRVDLDEATLTESEERRADELIALDEALAKFAQIDELKANLVKLRYFAGLTVQQAAQAMDISPTTAERHWDYARAWLYAEIERNGDRPTPH